PQGPCADVRGMPARVRGWTAPRPSATTVPDGWSPGPFRTDRIRLIGRLLAPFFPDLPGYEPVDEGATLRLRAEPPSLHPYAPVLLFAVPAPPVHQLGRPDPAAVTRSCPLRPVLGCDGTAGVRVTGMRATCSHPPRFGWSSSVCRYWRSG